MASATVLLKEGKSYTYGEGPNPIKFVEGQAVPVHGRELIDKLKAISCLAVEEHEDKPVTPLKAAKKGPAAKAAPQPDPEPEEEPEDELEGSDEGEVEVETEIETEGDVDVQVETEVEVEAAAEPAPAKPAAKNGGKFQKQGKKG